MMHSKRLLALIYLAALIASWLVMSNRHTPLPHGSEWREIPIPASGGNQAMLRYRKFPGSDPMLAPLILVHGSPMASSCFDPLLDSLSHERTILVPDLPGFGASSSGFSDFSFQAHADALERLLKAENHKAAHWTAYSQGGGPVLELSAGNPAACTSLVLLSSIGVQEHELTGDYFLNHILHGAQWIVLECLRWGIPHFGVLDDIMLNTRYARNFLHGDMRPLRGHLEKLAAPVLIVHGERDGLVPPSAASEHFRIVPQSRAVWLADGHMLPISRATTIAAMIDGFLKDVETGAAPKRDEADPARIANAAKPLNDTSRALSGMSHHLTLAAIALATLASEDLACLAAGLLAARGLIPLFSAIAAAFLGIFIGDMLLYLAGRYGGRWCVERAPLRWIVNRRKLDAARSYLRKNGAMAVFVTRFMPGTRLPLYVAAGIVKVPAHEVALWFMLAGLAWAIPVVSLTAFFGERAVRWLLTNGAAVFPAALAIIVLMWVMLKLLTRLATHRGRRILWAGWQRLVRWEFWPPWLFYPPVVIAVFLIALRRGKLLAFTAANPAIPHGGIAGESKADILSNLLPSGNVAPFLKLAAAAPDKIELVRNWNPAFPLVVKPDVGERGKGVVIVRDEASLLRELESRDADTIVQRYIDGAEFGVFYIRRPEEARGRIFSVTIKVLTSVIGDGERTLDELILDDDRAVLSHRHFLEIHRDRLHEIPAKGEVFRLANLGTHCRGALFLNGANLVTPALEAEIQRISSVFPGFHFGRFDLRCPDEEHLKRGEGIHVIELNGVTSEATHIYHPGTPLLDGYRTLVSQWRHACDIGMANAAAGAKVSSWIVLASLVAKHFKAGAR
jgi:membrane protein DedA with SNARE-associated domain/pimeloyl-ACP methyl ester carboxylesterase